MFVNEELQEHLETSSSINSNPLVTAEWNLNVAENISVIGNYRFRPADEPGSLYSSAINFFDINDCENEVKFWCGATDADVVVDGGLDNNDQPIAFVQPNEKERLLYSLEDCFLRFRPRSGINKLRYFEENYTHFVNSDLASRPRYYMASRNDKFKYWTSYRKEEGIERGIANRIVGPNFYIDDAAPFVVYKNKIPTNKIVVKMQTNVGSVNLGPFSGGSSTFPDPFFGLENQTTPNSWKIQVLKENNWVDAISFSPLSKRINGSEIIDSDGYVEISYGLIVPEKYLGNIYFVGKYQFESLLPVNQPIGAAFFVQENDSDLGAIYVSNGDGYDSFIPSYGWYLSNENVTELTSFVTKFVNPDYFIDGNGEKKYKEFEYIRGIRVLVESMNKINSTFDLIEISPRLSVSLTDRVKSFSVNKSASDIGVSGIPVGQLLAANGTLDIFDSDQSFSKTNTDSILSDFVSNNLKVSMFEIISYEKDNEIHEYQVPIKTMYADGFPVQNSSSREFSLDLRDLFLYFESTNAPQLLVENASLSYAVSFLLDSIGFSNYSFKRLPEEDDPVIPYFFVRPETTVAQVLQDLAVATQTAMFFDEYNNFIMMSKDYVMPSEEGRATDLELLGSPDQEKVGVLENKNKNKKLANIIDLSSQSQEVFNDGQIVFEEKYIQKTYGELKQASFVNQDQNWIYLPVLLWEVAGTPPLRSIQESEEATSSFALSAIPLNSDLSDQPPFVENHQLQNNIIDFGEGAYWVTRYNGYLYANGEIIKYDAIEYNVSGIGNVWISSLREYQNYFSKLQFGGKIYPTGRVRIFSEPDYEEINEIVVMKNGKPRKHGRGQFGTEVVYHHAGLSEYWSDTTTDAPVGGIHMDSSYMFSTFENEEISGMHNQPKLLLDVAIEIEEPNSIKSVVFADNKWVAVGTDGQFRSSSNGKDWDVVVDEDFLSGYDFNSIAYGAGPTVNRWIAAGSKKDGGNDKAILAYSEDTVNWIELDPNLGNKKINKIVYANNTWMVVGTEALIATSTNGVTWASKTARLDFTVFGSNKPKILSQTFQETQIKIAKIDQGNPAVVTRKNHRLKENDKIVLTTSGTLPAGLATGTTYFVSYRTPDTFGLKLSKTGLPITATSKGSGTHRYNKLAATFKVSKHGLSDGQKIKVIPSGTPPANISADTIYRVRYVSSDTISLSTESGEDLIDYASAQNKTSHKIERFVRSSINSVKYANNQWVVVGNNGAVSFSSNTNSWTAVKAGFENSRVFDLDYGSGFWVVVGESGKARRSANLSSWSSLSTKIKNNIYAVKHYASIFLVAGQNGKMSRATFANNKLSKWSSVNPQFRNSDILQIEVKPAVVSPLSKQLFMAIGQKLHVSISADGLSWSDSSQENFGELVFKTEIPHEFTSYDTIAFTSTGNLPSNQKITITSIELGNPANFNLNDHGLQTNDQIMLSTTGTLPTGLNTTSVYYVIRVDKDKFRLATKPSGTAIRASGSLSGVQSYYRPSVLDARPSRQNYYVTPKNISERSFTVATSREAARLGITLKASGAQSGRHRVQLYLEPEYKKIASIAQSSGKVLVTTEAVHELRPNDRIFFGVRNQTSFVEKNIVAGLTRYAPYYVQAVTGQKTFLVSDKLNGEAIDYIDFDVQLSNNEFFALIYNVTEEILKTNLIVPEEVNVFPGNLLEISGGEGELVSPTRVAALRSANFLTKTISNISIANPAIITCADHGLFSSDEVSFTSSGFLPFGIDTNQKYLVQKISNNTFSLLDPKTKTSIQTRVGIIPETEKKDIASISIASPAVFVVEEHGLKTNSTIRLLTTGSLPTGFNTSTTYYIKKIDDNSFSLSSTPDGVLLAASGSQSGVHSLRPAYRQQFKVHSFVKDINDKNRLVLSRSVNKELRKYAITTEKVSNPENPSLTIDKDFFKDVSFENKLLVIQELDINNTQKAGFSESNKELARTASRNGIIKNYFAKSSFSETDINKFLSTQSGTVQASALIFNGPSFETVGDDPVIDPINFLSYIHKSLENKFTHFGTRMRIVGRVGQEEAEQIVYNSMNFFLNPEASLDQEFSVYGGSAGLGIMVNPETNVGYYFEIMALSQSNVAEYSEDVGLFNVAFYKIVRRVPNPGEPAVQDDDKAIPIKLWQGVTNVIADSGDLVGQFRMFNESSPSVYDLSLEYEDIDENNRKFYLMINNQIIAVVDDDDPLPNYNNFCLFVRGSTRAMFENVYAVANNYSQNTVFELDVPVNSVFGSDKVNISDSFRKYSLSGAVQSTYLSGINIDEPPKYNIYFEEFGTIMREAAYFNIRYDKAYPALYAQISPTFTKMKGYTVSGFTPSAYGAEFLVFNNTDTALNLDETSGNYLRIQGVSFTQSSQKELTVDNYFNRISNLSNPQLSEDGLIISPTRSKQEFLDIRNSRITYGRKEFSIESNYIQSQDEANDLMGWIISKIMKPRKSIGVTVFGMPTIQLGDIVSIDYKSNEGVDQISVEKNRFVVYNISYSRSETGPSMDIYLSEVI